jgi:hypothetical protein
MNKLFFLSASALVAMVSLALVAPGCGDACEDLEPLCDLCGDATYRASCEASLDRDNQDVCSAVRSQFEIYCVEESAGGSGGGDGFCLHGEVICEGSCTDVQSTAEFCGNCVSPCAEGQLCATGVCVDSCPVTFPDVCGTGCVDTQSDPLHCGDCDTECAADEVCFQGACGPGCDAMSATPTECEGSCVDLSNDPRHCGACGNTCSPGQVCASGACADSCGDDLLQCCGKCINPENDPGHCGGCDPSCPETVGGATPAGAVCEGMNDVCLNGTCAPNCGLLSECNGGSCVDTQSDPLHCGVCNNVCPLGTVCSGGACSNSGCADGETECNGSCVNVQDDPFNCGECGTVCGGGTPKCNHGQCAAACSDIGALAFTDCSNSCVDTQSDPDHCGGCDMPCSSTDVCSVGACQPSCVAPLVNCNGACVNTNTHFDNCGACGTSCNDKSVCTSDSCDGMGSCDNASGALVCNDGNQCTQDMCDPMGGCTAVDVTTAQLSALCPAPGAGECLHCDPDGETCNSTNCNVPCAMGACNAADGCIGNDALCVTNPGFLCRPDAPGIDADGCCLIGSSPQCMP